MSSEAIKTVEAESISDSMTLQQRIISCVSLFPEEAEQTSKSAKEKALEILDEVLAILELDDGVQDFPLLPKLYKDVIQ